MGKPRLNIPGHMFRTVPHYRGGYVVRCKLEYSGIKKVYVVKIWHKRHVPHAKIIIMEKAHEDANRIEFKGET